MLVTGVAESTRPESLAHWLACRDAECVNLKLPQLHKPISKRYTRTWHWPCLYERPWLTQVSIVCFWQKMAGYGGSSRNPVLHCMLLLVRSCYVSDHREAPWRKIKREGHRPNLTLSVIQKSLFNIWSFKFFVWKWVWKWSHSSTEKMKCHSVYKVSKSVAGSKQALNKWLLWWLYCILRRLCSYNHG